MITQYSLRVWLKIMWDKTILLEASFYKDPLSVYKFKRHSFLHRIVFNFTCISFMLSWRDLTTYLKAMVRKTLAIFY